MSDKLVKEPPRPGQKPTDLFGMFNAGINYLATPVYAPECDMDSVPEELKVKGGVCLVIGCHPCWKEDMDAALARYPDAKICTVNYAVELTRGDYIATVHGGYMPQFIDIHKKMWGETNPIIIQRDCAEFLDLPGSYKIKVRTLACSGSFAAAAISMLGYDLSILCGSPIDGSGGYAQQTCDGNDWVVHERHNRIRAWQQGMIDFKFGFPEIADRIRSMSGGTKRIFGGIDDN